MGRSPLLTASDFQKALEQVILPDDEVVVIYSGIWTFGHLFGWEVRDIADRLLDIIEEFIGDDRTLLFPSFCASNFIKTRKFDLVRSRPVESGIIPTRAICRTGYLRTRKPIHSYLVKGPKANEVLSLPSTTSWGDDGILGWMGKVNARICPLGLPWHQACSYFHRIEETTEVPYRYYKRFAGVLLEDGKNVGSCEEVKYSYSLKVRPHFDHTIVYPQLKKANAVLSGGNPYIPLESAKAINIDEVCEELFSANPYAFVTNSEGVKNWVVNGKDEEVASLTPDEQWSNK